MVKNRPLVTVAALLAMAACALAASKPDEAKLIGILESDAPPAQKAIPCKQLAIYGTQDAVPALAKLLGDKELASWARIALEAIPDPAADDALRAAVPTLEGRLLIGTINSIGVRRDPKAVALLAGKLEDPDAGVASAAAEALGRIGGDRAVQALQPLLSSAPPAVRPSVAYGCILCAERLLEEGKADEATKLYDTVRQADVPKRRRLAATRGAILARRGAAGVPLLVELLRSDDQDSFDLGLRVARELGGVAATEALVAELDRLEPARKAMLIYALADRGDPKALPAVLAVAKGGAKALRLVAIEALAGFGDASCLPVLLAAAVEADAEVARAAMGTLLKLPGEEVDADIAARLPKASGKTRQVLIELARRRWIKAALPALMASAGAPDPSVRAAAVAAIGAIGGEAQLPGLVAILQKTEDSKERSEIGKALAALSARAGAACVPELMPLTKSGDAALHGIALRALAAAGGPDALAAVKAALESNRPAVRDEAVRTLSIWPNKWPEDDGVVEPLLGLVKSSSKLQHRVLALRGYLQYLQGTKELAPAARLARVNEVLPLVERPEGKRLAISVLAKIPKAGVLDMLVAYAEEPKIAEEACSAIVGLAGNKALPKEERRKALQTALEKAKSGRTKRRARNLLKALR
ncbi:MAG: HEAT repeat domain-containing protein [Candidatus Brocadiia bacterium]